jgi:hypothetical protein
MSGTGWSLVEVASKVLENNEREAVLGDLAEAGESPWRGVLEICGLAVRRQAGLWRDRQPWLAAFGFALPSAYLLMYVSVSVSCTYQRLIHHKDSAGWPTGHEGFLLLLCHVFLLITWSWTGGYVVAWVSRRTLWMSAALSLLPCMVCVARFPFESLPKLCLFLFLVPAALGVREGLRHARIALGSASILAAATTALMILAWCSKALWILNWALIWPVLYLVATALSSQEGRSSSLRRMNRAGWTGAS